MTWIFLISVIAAAVMFIPAPILIAWRALDLVLCTIIHDFANNPDFQTE